MSSGSGLRPCGTSRGAVPFVHIPFVTLWLFNIAMENGPFIDGLPIKNDDFPWLCQITRWYILYLLLIQDAWCSPLPYCWLLVVQIRHTYKPNHYWGGWLIVHHYFFLTKFPQIFAIFLVLGESQFLILLLLLDHTIESQFWNYFDDAFLVSSYVYMYICIYI